jgi:chitinase
MITLGDIGQGDCPDLSVAQPSTIDDIREFIAFGGEVILSISGATCRNTPGKRLADALIEVMENTGIHEIDFDVEGLIVGSAPDLELRNQAIIELERRFPHLFVSFTLGVTPVIPDYDGNDPNAAGLGTGGNYLVKGTLASGARIDRITIMPFDFGFPKELYDRYPFYKLDEMSVENVADQMKALFSKDPAHPISRKRIYSMIGVLPAIGEGVREPVAFLQRDAFRLGNWARHKGLSMISYYVFQRDQKQNSYGQLTEDYLNRFSGVPQKDFEFFDCFQGIGECADPTLPNRISVGNRDPLIPTRLISNWESGDIVIHQ